MLGEPLERPERYLGRVGALVEGPALWPALTAVENLRVLARLGGQRRAPHPRACSTSSASPTGPTTASVEYSLGMKQRLGIAAALLGDPELLVLDEPTNGLDPVGISDMRDLIGRLAAENRTVLVSSHLLSELEQVCDWLLIIDQGRLVYAGEAQGFAAKVEHRDPSSHPADDRRAPAARRRGGGRRARRRARRRPPRRRRRRPRPAPLAARSTAPRRRPASSSPSCTSAAPRSNPPTSACSKETAR